MVNYKRFDVFLGELDPTKGREINKTRPCVIISPDDLNDFIGTVIIAPMTTQGYAYPTRVPVTFKRKKGHIILDQIRTIDKSRLVKKLGRITASEAELVLKVLAQLFAK